MNEEKKIAQTIMDAMKAHEASYIRGTARYDGGGRYKIDMEQCLIDAGQKNGLSKNLWALLNLAMHWINDIQLWAEDILAGSDIKEDGHEDGGEKEKKRKWIG